MHTGSVSHLGVVIFPTLLALAQQKRVTGRDFIVAAVCGYETGAAVGRAVMDQETVRRFRPTGITGPIGWRGRAAACLLGLSEDASVSALGLAANTTVGLNEWPADGADEMFFHVGLRRAQRGDLPWNWRSWAPTHLKLRSTEKRDCSRRSASWDANRRSTMFHGRSLKSWRSITSPRPPVTTRRPPARPRSR